MIIKIIKALWIGVRVLWILLTVSVLAVTLYLFYLINPSCNTGDIGIFFIWLMIYLTFPSGLLVVLVYGALNKWFPVTDGCSYLGIVPFWMALFALGYFQWFKLLPYLITKLRGLIEKKFKRRQLQ